MPKVKFVQPDQSVVIVDVLEGQSVMEAATAASVVGIVAECGGNAACATCHVYVDGDPDVLPPMSEIEDEMLDGAAAERTDRSRLSCQVLATEDFEGLVIEIPETQV